MLSESQKIAIKKYLQSEKGKQKCKEAQQRYFDSEGGREARRKYMRKYMRKKSGLDPII